MHNREEAYIFAEKEVHYIRQSGLHPYLNYALLDFARACNTCGKQRKSIQLPTEVLDSANYYNDSALAQSALQNIALSSFSISNYSKARAAFEELFSKGMANNMDSIYYYMTLANDREAKAALNLIKKISNVEDKYIEYTKFTAYKSLGNYKEALESMSRLHSIEDSLFQQAFSNNFVSILGQKNRISTQAVNDELDSANLTILLCSICILLLILLLFVSFKYLFSRQKKAN